LVFWKMMQRQRRYCYCWIHEVVWNCYHQVVAFVLAPCSSGRAAWLLRGPWLPRQWESATVCAFVRCENRNRAFAISSIPGTIPEGAEHPHSDQT
jgi:hypothetical protein